MTEQLYWVEREDGMRYGHNDNTGGASLWVGPKGYHIKMTKAVAKKFFGDMTGLKLIPVWHNANI